MLQCAIITQRGAPAVHQCKKIIYPTNWSELAAVLLLQLQILCIACGTQPSCIHSCDDKLHEQLHHVVQTVVSEAMNKSLIST